MRQMVLREVTLFCPRCSNEARGVSAKFVETYGYCRDCYFNELYQGLQLAAQDIELLFWVLDGRSIVSMAAELGVSRQRAHQMLKDRHLHELWKAVREGGEVALGYQAKLPIKSCIICGMPIAGRRRVLCGSDACRAARFRQLEPMRMGWKVS